MNTPWSSHSVVLGAPSFVSGSDWSAGQLFFREQDKSIWLVAIPTYFWYSLLYTTFCLIHLRTVNCLWSSSGKCTTEQTDTYFSFPLQLPCWYSDIPAVQQRLDKGEDLRPPPQAGPASKQIMGAPLLRGFGEGLDNRCVQSVVVNVLYYSHPVAILINSLARTDCIFRDTRILLIWLCFSV